MKDTLTKVSSNQLEELQNQLNQLAEELKETYDLVCNGLKELNEDWRDEKFDEFDREFNSSRQEISDISDRFKEYANQYLPPFIEKTRKIENFNLKI